MHLRRPALACLLPLALASPTPTRAAERMSAAVGRSATPLRIDGTLDEPAWGSAARLEGFRLIDAREGEMPAESTLVRVLVDRDRIVFGMWLQSSRPPRASLAPRDQILSDDHISIHLDPDLDRKTAFIFGVNAYGVQLDGVLADEPDFKWDGVWESECRRGDGAWTAEVAIPFRLLRFAEGGSSWGAWFRRENAARNEVSSWPPYKRGQPGAIMLQAGDLIGFAEARGGHGIDVEPYAAGSIARARWFDVSGEPQAWSDDRERNAGVDVRAAVTSGLTLNATLLPDFSQIESDALEVGLNRRFPLSFPEKRPFFLEGAEVFELPIPLVYTRRIADPRYGVKVAGSIDRLRTGLLFVRDDGGADPAGVGAGPTDDLTRRGTFALARGIYDLNESSSLGAFVSLHEQDDARRAGASAGTSAGAFAPAGSSNRLVGLDTRIQLSRHWTVFGQATHSVSAFDSARATSPPPGDGLGGSKRESLSDWLWLARVTWRDDRRNWQFGSRRIGREFRDEVGFFERVDYIQQRSFFDWSLYPKRGPLRRFTPNVLGAVIHGTDHRLEEASAQLGFDMEYHASVFIWPNVTHKRERWLSRMYDQQRIGLFVEDDRWRAVGLKLDASVGDGIVYGDTDASSFLAWVETADVTATLRPSARVTSAVNVKRLRIARRPGSGEVLSLWLLGANTTMQFTRRLYARVYPQYDDGAKHIAVSALLGYVAHPGTVVYVGVNGGFDEVSGRRRASARQVFAKTSWRIGL